MKTEHNVVFNTMFLGKKKGSLIRKKFIAGLLWFKINEDVYEFFVFSRLLIKVACADVLWRSNKIWKNISEVAEILRDGKGISKLNYRCNVEVRLKN